MRKVILVILSSAICLYAHAANFHYLENRIPQSNMRYSTFLYGLDLMSANQVQTIVETGTARYGNENFLWDGGGR